MNIQICPVKKLYRILAETGTATCAAVISATSDIDAGKLRGIPCVIRQYEDLDYPCPGRAFSPADAEAFADFLRCLDEPIDTLFCCCDAGESRSPAVAAAAARYLGADDLPIWQDPHYHPNMLVFEMLSAALGTPVSDAELDLRIYVNHKAFRDAIRSQ